MDVIEGYFSKLKKGLDSLNRETIKKIIKVLFDAYREDNQIFIFGNGGSASTASHFACDIGKGTVVRNYERNFKRFKVISLSDNIALITAYGNDLSFDDIFSQQLNNLLKKDDVVIALTGSGNSTNIIKAVKTAKELGAKTIGFLGFDGGKVKDLVDYPLVFKDDHYGRIEDSHLILEHLISSILCDMINS